MNCPLCRDGYPRNSYGSHEALGYMFRCLYAINPDPADDGPEVDLIHKAWVRYLVEKIMESPTLLQALSTRTK